jgi:mono/diheme cytochrome c family protein
MNKFNALLVTTLLLSSSGIATIAHANESVAVAAEKSRQAIILTEKERSLVLLEMRGFLESVQSITSALAKDDWAGIAKAAKKSGRAEQGAMPPSLGKKLPKEFKILGMKTHQAFDALALDSKEMEDKQQTLEQLGSLMKNCVSCHAIFKFEIEK